MILDTAAHIANARGEHANAAMWQREALEIEPGNAGYRAALGRFLMDAGNLDEAEPLIARAALEGADDPVVAEAFQKLAVARTGSAEALDYKEGILDGAAHQMLLESEDPSETSLVLAKAFAGFGVHLGRALGYAELAVANAGKDAGLDEYKNARVTLATVYSAMGESERALKYVTSVEPLASVYDTDLFLTHGAILETLGRDAEAIDAYLAGAAVPRPVLIERLGALWEKVHGGSEGLTEAVEKTVQELEQWHPDGHFEVPEDWSGRVVLAELFTGSECPPCVASDLAFDGLIEYYPDSVVAILEYHEHIPRPDPMTNEDTVARMDFYTRNVVQGTPTVIINGTDSSVGGGGAAAAKGRFGMYSWSIEKAMAEGPAISIALDGSRDGDSVAMQASASVDDADAVADMDLRLRVALAEGVVHYEGSNGVAEHKIVVRTFLGGPDGFKIEATSGESSFNARTNLSELEAQLLEYLEGYESDPANARRFGSTGGFTAKKHQIDRSNLLLVAFVQDDASKAILQAKVLELK
jgi:tetratricopeptide (TPR) repeat protein